MDDRFQHNHYLVKGKFFEMFSRSCTVYGPDGTLLFYSKLKFFKWKEGMRIYSDMTMQTEVLRVEFMPMFTMNPTFAVYDSQTNEKVGGLQRHGWKSILRDQWTILDSSDQAIGTIMEDSGLLAFARRFLTNLIPQKYIGKIGEKTVLHFKQNFNPLLLKIDLDYSDDTEHLLDRRLGIMAGVMLCAVEGRQQ